MADRQPEVPAFLIVGAPKCGTTALAELLSSHPNISISKPKEPHFFDGGFAAGLDSYRASSFPGHRPGMVAGEATPSYLMLPFVAPRIHSSLPNARLIAVLRDPVERAFSSWWMFHARGMEPLGFAEAIDAERREIEAGRSLDDESAWISHLDSIRSGDEIRIRTYLESGHYARHLRRYMEYFPLDRMRVVFTHELADTTEYVVRDLWRYLGVDDAASMPNESRANEAIGRSAAPLMKFLKATGLMKLRSLLPESLKGKIKRGLASAGEKPKMDPDTRAWLTEYYRPHVAELEVLQQRSLPGWLR